ncbi:expressed unknown protein [Seminavis robusta]|uniref:DUF1995 domain-containing protein n=1 Tax=Seminavis robusta TaxID=568900 RepID=A0A9N8H4U4_9STRA|nr:expressed unknown protein [Seminavis robusta]|eukprot:Sro58_g033690.1 n/a (288) ;mRNA; r:53816-54925
MFQKLSWLALLAPLLAEGFVSPQTPASLPSSPSTTRLGLFGGSGAKIPSSPADRDNQAIAGVKAAIGKPKTRGFPLIECEFPPLVALNKLGDGSMRSAIEVDQANLAFCSKLIKSISVPLLGPKVWLLTSGGAANAFQSKAEKAVKGSATVASLRNGIPEGISKGDVCIFISPNGRGDYNVAKTLAETTAKAVVVVNGLAKDQDSVPGRATMAYYLKPLTYNSQVAGYLIRSYPGQWTVLDAVTKKSLGSFSDNEILFGNSNTPDLRESGRLVQKSTDDRAIAARSR